MRTSFGHGKEHLPAVLTAMNLIAFAMHTVADLVKVARKTARAAVGARNRFFEDLRVIAACLVFQSGAVLLEALCRGNAKPAVTRDG